MVPKDRNLTQSINCCATLLLFRKECYYHFIYTSRYLVLKLKSEAAEGEPAGNASGALRKGGARRQDGNYFIADSCGRIALALLKIAASKIVWG